MGPIRWEDPPPRSRGEKGTWVERLQPLLAHPKRWAVVRILPANRARQVAHLLTRKGVLMPPGRWEFASRIVDGEGRVYARYLGPDEDGGGGAR
jgi:hypothetical protein